jgi:hypothetical protein
VDRIRREYAPSTHYLAAANQLKRLQQFRGYPSSAHWYRFIARVHRERAWFLTHAGHVESALRDARQADAAGRVAHRYAPSADDARQDLQALAETALITSQAHLLNQDPVAALQALETVEAALEAARRPLGSDYYRQRAVALLQLGADLPAQRFFARSMTVMKAGGEASRPIEVEYTGSRYLHLLSGSWDDAALLAHEVADNFGADTLHACVARHWAVATGLATGSPNVRREARAILLAREPSRTFGHQRTLGRLLACTPDLGLAAAVQSHWIRFALYQNGVRRR